MSPNQGRPPVNPCKQLERVQELLAQSQETIHRIRQAIEQTEELLKRLSQDQEDEKP
jgi:uncharacterized protein YecA (UPF0149 family)